MKPFVAVAVVAGLVVLAAGAWRQFCADLSNALVGWLNDG